jgi:3-dehydroquinate synthase
MRYVVITDKTVEGLYGTKLCRFLNGLGFDVTQVAFPAGEAHKSRTTKERLEDLLFEHHFRRDTTMIALGGGVVCDLVGFLAATYCRGVDLILIPTTLVAMCDAAIGGKTGVNTEQGKNLVGAFYLPKALFIEPRFLKTLSGEDLFCGKVEILKAGLIADPDLFYRFSELSLEDALFRAIEVKRRLVALDLKDEGRRAYLNLGHTLGHAIEAASNFKISHGKAVAMGLVLEAKIGFALGLLNETVLLQIEKAFAPCRLNVPPELILKTLWFDKKIREGALKFVLLKEIGQPVVQEVDLKLVKEVLDDAALCSC